MATVGTQSDFDPHQDEVEPTPHVPLDTWVERHGTTVGLLVGIAAVIATLLRYVD
ncbi:MULTISPECIES: hypothetical protein [Isoptericola]|uniref:Uncharacterized protein n=1 Tax=Isoptericola sediminis TaxID=2733572 RepID=A0A849K3A8_9MICO|nr:MULTISPECIES: hypothetical protein [Isoptericola]MDO8145494.1 hypothetical protein [Isoptericola sp. 178]MDO8149135.1 hypothetical protein [Isoptericola sp. b515]MDO8150920.1 hypothetical protein [Isoptericola sp. b408]NNU27758.1 hypothetical protein [Isoptericola sediminis]